MADANQKHSLDDQLLSAYVDGELTEGERAQVERKLREDPKARELVAELQAMSESLRSLPPESLGEDLREPILRQAERAMLLGDQPVQAVSVDIRRREAHESRRWVWAAMAAAAALFLMAYLPAEKQQEQAIVKAQPRVGRAIQSAPEWRAPAEQSLADATDEMEEPSASSFAEESAEKDEQFASEPISLVHITLANAQDAPHRFDELLQSQGIALQREAGVALADADDALRKDEGLDSEAVPDLESSDATAEPQLVLVEALPDQMDRLLTACNADTTICQSLRIEMEEGAAPRFARWQALERDGLAAAKLSARGSNTLGKESIAARPQALRLEEDKQHGADKKDGNEAIAQTGRATRLGGQWRRDLDKAKTVDVRGGARFAQRSRADRLESDLAQAAEPSDSEMIRVLFVLHAAAPSSESEARPSAR